MNDWIHNESDSSRYRIAWEEDVRRLLREHEQSISRIEKDITEIKTVIRDIPDIKKCLSDLKAQSIKQGTTIAIFIVLAQTILTVFGKWIKF